MARAVTAPNAAGGGEYRGARRRLIETLQANGIGDLAVLRAFDLVPRHAFVPSGVAHRAYEDAALPIGNGQTISQPSVHARSLQELRLTGRERVLEIGTGSAFQTVLLSHLAAQVFSIERVEQTLCVFTRRDGALERREVGPVRFVPLLGAHGWAP